MSTEFVKTLPTSWYHDPSIFEKERRSIFQKEWLYAFHASELPETGSYLSVSMAGFPLVFVRGRQGEIQGFHNVCRHRGAPLVRSESGRLETKLLSCPYHGWIYDLEGQLKSAPYCEFQNQSDRADLSLLKVQTHNYRGLVFITLSSEAPPFDKQFASFMDTVEKADYRFENYRFHSKISREGDFNWKLWIDGYQECYHCPTVHPILNRDFYLGRYAIENFDRYSRHSCERKTASTSGSDSGLWLWMYPNLGLPCYEPAFYTLQVNPISACRTRLTYTFHFAEQQTQDEIAQFLAFVEQITDEDMNICAQVHKNYENSILEHGLLHASREKGVIFFHDKVYAAVSGGGSLAQ